MQITPPRPTPQQKTEPVEAKSAETRTETASTKLTPSENEELKAAARQVGCSVAEWLREAALSAARKEAPITLELILEELCALRQEHRNCTIAYTKANRNGEFIEAKALDAIHDLAEKKKVQKAQQVAQLWRIRQADGAEK